MRKASTVVEPPGLSIASRSSTKASEDPEASTSSEPTMATPADNPTPGSVKKQQTSIPQERPSRPPSPYPTAQPTTPQLLPKSDLSTPNTPTPLSRKSSTEGFAPRSTGLTSSSQPDISTKERRPRFFPSFFSLSAWRGRPAKDSTEPTTTPQEAPKYSRPLVDKSFFQKCAACRLPMESKDPHTCSAGMNIDECRKERKKRKRQKAEAEAEKNEAAGSNEIPSIVVDEEGPVHRLATIEPIKLENEEQAEVIEEGKKRMTKRGSQEWQVL